MLKSENARPSGWIYIDMRGCDLASVVGDLRREVAQHVRLEPSMSWRTRGSSNTWSANEGLKVVVPATLLIILVLLYLTFRRAEEAALIMATLPLPLAPTGGIWFLYLLGYNLSVATGVASSRWPASQASSVS